MPCATTHLLYLHGFRSSPQSAKARITGEWIAAHRPEVKWWCPQLPPSPADAIRMIFDGVRDWPHESMGVIGSSLGGYYATSIAEQLGCRAVVLNPAIEPARDLEKYIGEVTAWHSDERFFFRREFIGELLGMRADHLTRLDRYFAVIAKGDEVLSWVEMTSRYRGCAIELIEGGDHAISDYESRLGSVVGFLGLS